MVPTAMAAPPSTTGASERAPSFGNDGTAIVASGVGTGTGVGVGIVVGATVGGAIVGLAEGIGVGLGAAAGDGAGGFVAAGRAVGLGGGGGGGGGTTVVVKLAQRYARRVSPDAWTVAASSRPTYRKCHGS
jgi:hypothetical protein